MNRKITLFNDIYSKILSKGCIAFYEKEASLTDTLIRQTLYFGNISVSLNPKFSASCIILSGIILEGLVCVGEKENFTIENGTDIYVISHKKLVRQSSVNYIYIYTLKHFVQLENIKQLYIKFFKYQPYMLKESVQYIFKIHEKRFKNIKLLNMVVKKRYFQSEFTVLFIAYVNSRVESNFERKYKIIYLLKFFYKIFLIIKSFSANDVFTFWKNNSHYFMVYNKNMYDDFFESDFVILNEFIMS